MEFYSATKKNKILYFAGKWMELEGIILSNGSQSQKTKGYMFSLICVICTQYKYNNIMKNRLCYGRGGHKQEREGKEGS
jgi:hypothetical protein